MTSDLLLTVLLIVGAIGAFVVWAGWRHYAEHRTEALQYESGNRIPPPSTVCPRCRRRSYSRRALAEHYCESCDLHYDVRADRRAAA